MLKFLLVAISLTDKVVTLSNRVNKMARQIDKPYDCNKFTDAQIKIIIDEYNSKESYNNRIRDKIISGKLVTNQELVNTLNARLSLNKSIRSYARIWHNQPTFG